jgi:hypothetical protein
MDRPEVAPRGLLSSRDAAAALCRGRDSLVVLDARWRGRGRREALIEDARQRRRTEHLWSSRLIGGHQGGAPRGGPFTDAGGEGEQFAAVVGGAERSDATARCQWRCPAEESLVRGAASVTRPLGGKGAATTRSAVFAVTVWPGRGRCRGSGHAGEAPLRHMAPGASGANCPGTCSGACAWV